MRVGHAVVVALGAAFLCGTANEVKQPVAPPIDLSTMAKIPAGTFVMGQPAETPGPYGDAWFEDQLPTHSVDLGAFWIDRTEVTVAEYALHLTYAAGESGFHQDQPIERVAAGYLPVGGAAHQAMQQVSWQDAASYCAWAGKRLPTEAEWERAAAGTTARLYPWGSVAPTCRHAAHFTGATFCATGSRTTGGRPAGDTPDGIRDLAGNVAEWIADWYGRYSDKPAANPQGPSSGTYKVVRGGGFLDGPLLLRSRARWAAPPARRSDDIGFRCVWSAPEALPVQRGPLAPPEDISRQPSVRPRAKPAPGPVTVADGLDEPTAIVVLDSKWYVIQKAQGRVSAVNRTNGAVTEVMSGLQEPVALATDGSTVIVSDRGAGKIWRLTPGSSPSLLIAGETQPGLVATRDGEVVWTTPTAVRAVSGSGATVRDIATGLDGVGSIALSPTEVFFAELGEQNATNARIARVARQGGQVTTVVGKATLGSQFRPDGLLLDEANGSVYVAIAMRGFPSTSAVARVPLATGKLAVVVLAPPGITGLVRGASHLYWASGHSLVRTSATDAGRIEYLGPWTTVGGISVSEEGVVWTDRASGQILGAGN